MSRLADYFVVVGVDRAGECGEDGFCPFKGFDEDSANFVNVWPYLAMSFVGVEGSFLFWYTGEEVKGKVIQRFPVQARKDAVFPEGIELVSLSAGNYVSSNAKQSWCNFASRSYASSFRSSFSSDGSTQSHQVRLSGVWPMWPLENDGPVLWYFSTWSSTFVWFDPVLRCLPYVWLKFIEIICGI